MSKFDAAWLNAETGEIHIPKARMVYPEFLNPKRIKDKPDSKPKFGATWLLPAKANIDLLKRELVEALKGKFGAEWQKNKKLLYPLLKTEDQERLAEYAKDYPFILRTSANEGFPPFIYNPNLSRFEGDASEIYSGRWGVCAGKFYAYDNVSKGVSFGLNRVQLLDHDEPIAGGRVATASGFEGVDVGGPSGGAAKSADEVFEKGGDEIPF